MSISSYADELLFLASHLAPWEVSEKQFLALVAMLSDGTPLARADREEIRRFLATAKASAALVDPRVLDASSIWRASVEAAKGRKESVYIDLTEEM